jgi:hypothetical protein
VDHAEQRADRELDAEPLPRLKLLPPPAVHPDLATLVAVCRARNYVAVAAVWQARNEIVACQGNIVLVCQRLSRNARRASGGW